MKKLGWAFVVGGLCSVVGQLFIFMWQAILGASHPLITPITMVSMGVVGFILFVTGIGPKLEQLTTMGVTIPISGMVIAVGGVTAGVKAQSGNTATGVKAGAMLPLRVLGTGAAISVILSSVLFFGTHGSLELAFEPVVFGPALDIVLSFVVGGAIALVAEAVLLATKAPMPVLLITFIVLGAVIGAFNLDAAPILNNGGYIVSLFGAGQAAYETFQVLLMGITPVPFIIVLCVYLCVTVLGLLAGVLGKAPAAPQGAGQKRP